MEADRQTEKHRSSDLWTVLEQFISSRMLCGNCCLEVPQVLFNRVNRGIVCLFIIICVCGEGKGGEEELEPLARKVFSFFQVLVAISRTFSQTNQFE